MNCIYCGDPHAHPGTRKCSNSTSCDLRSLRADVESRIAAAVTAEREAWNRVTGADSPEALDFTLGRLSLNQWIDHTRAALTAIEREACAKLADDAVMQMYARGVECDPQRHELARLAESIRARGQS